MGCHKLMTDTAVLSSVPMSYLGSVDSDITWEIAKTRLYGCLGGLYRSYEEVRGKEALSSGCERVVQSPC